MRQRQRAGKPAEITFTCDYHELVSGELRPGGRLLLRYDPYRIVPPDDPSRFGDPQRLVIAHLVFRESAPSLDIPLRSPAGIIPCPDVDPTGQGSMVSAALQVPDDADRLVIWFSYASANGAMHFDSDFGADYRFGFPCRELEVLQATVARLPDEPLDRFELRVRTTAPVEAVAVQFTLIADPLCARREFHLHRADEIAAQRQPAQWTATIGVPHGAIARFKLIYRIGGRRLVDDNTGAWYLAPEPPTDRPPPPPPALLRAAADWR